jgi:hypothetical protein
MNPADISAAPHEPWYKYGAAVMLFEIAVAIAVSGYSLYVVAERSAPTETIDIGAVDRCAWIEPGVTR